MHPKIRAISPARTIIFSLFASLCVFGFSLLVQWFIYDDWLRERGPLRVVGTSIATVLTFAFAVRWQYLARQNQQAMLRRFEAISRMSDRIRNAMQVIACLSFAHQPEFTEQVWQALDVIDNELDGVVRDAGLLPPGHMKIRAGGGSIQRTRTSA